MKTKKKILVIDDSETNNILIKSLFEETEKYVVFIENNSIKALDKTIKHNPDVILLDLMMPFKDGITVFNELKNHPLTENIPVIIVSARYQKKEVELIMKMGAVDYVMKPIGIHNILERVEKVLWQKDNSHSKINTR